MHPQMVAPLLPEFAQAWCQALYEIRDNEEKDSAFRGLCTLVQTNPAGIAKVSTSTSPCLILPTEPFSESPLVLQRDRQVEQPIAGAKRDVSAASGRVQAARRAGMGRAGVHIPAGHTREAADAVRCIDGLEWNINFLAFHVPRLLCFCPARVHPYGMRSAVADFVLESSQASCIIACVSPAFLDLLVAVAVAVAHFSIFIIRLSSTS